MKNKILIKKSDAVKHFGSESSLARAVGVNRQAVNQWGEFLPDSSAWLLHHITKGGIQTRFNLPEETQKSA